MGLFQVRNGWSFGAPNKAWFVFISYYVNNSWSFPKLKNSKHFSKLILNFSGSQCQRGQITQVIFKSQFISNRQQNNSWLSPVSCRSTTIISVSFSWVSQCYSQYKDPLLRHRNNFLFNFSNDVKTVVWVFDPYRTSSHVVNPVSDLCLHSLLTILNNFSDQSPEEEWGTREIKHGCVSVITYTVLSSDA